MNKQSTKLVRSIEDVMIQFLRIINKYNRFEKVPLDFGIEEKLFPIEIHTVDAIGRYPGISVTKLAKLTGVTKGAVSQKIRLLEKKDLVKKRKSDTNDKEVQLELTERGRKAFEGHETFHDELYAEIIEEMKDLTIRQIDMFGDMMDKVEIQFDRYIEKYLE